MSRELSAAESTLQRHEADFAMQGIGSEDQVTAAIGYLTNFDRLLAQLPEDKSAGPTMPWVSSLR